MQWALPSLARGDTLPAGELVPGCNKQQARSKEDGNAQSRWSLWGCRLRRLDYLRSSDRA